MSSVNPKKLKVLELKRELEQRSIPVSKSMKKAELVALLVSALESEVGQDEAFSSEGQDASSVSEAEKDQTRENSEISSELNTTEDEANSKLAVEEEDVSETVNTRQGETVLDLSDQNSQSGQPVSPRSSDPEVQHILQMADNAENKPAVQELCLEHPKSDPPKACQEEIPDVHCIEEGKRVSPKVEMRNNQDLGRKRKYQEKSDKQSDWEDGHVPPEREEEEFDDSVVVLDVYNSDLNFKISRDRVSGQPLTMEGFAFLWAGVRATYGVRSGKVCFECKITQEDPVKHLPSDEPHPHVVRVGWSADYSSLQLGEDTMSYGYGGTGKFSTDNTFSDFGETFRAGDVIGCYINFCDEDHMQLSYTKNGVFQGIAFTGANPCDKALFPHVLCKNTSVELNFGQREIPYHNHPMELDGYVFLSSVAPEERVRAVVGPQSKKQCEVLMMCGLPGAGKTYYCRQKMENQPEKKYNVLGTNIIMEKMRVMGVTRKKNYAGRWDLLIDNATQCLNRLLQIACRKRRNYILDQTNVYASAQRRKMRPFEGFQRKAIVIVPTEEDYKMRFEKRTDDEGKEVPEMAILGMKANFTLPEEGDLFDEVIFTELDREEAKKIVDKYREDGKKHGPPPEKRFRGENRHRNRDNGWRRGRNLRMQPGFMNETWGAFGSPTGVSRGAFAGGFNRGGGYGGRQPGFGTRGRDYGLMGRRDNFSQRNERSSARGKGSWMEHGGRGTRGGYGVYSRHSQGRGGLGVAGDKNFQGSNNALHQGNRLSHNNPQSFAPQSAQSYTYGQNQQYNAQSAHSYGSTGYSSAQQSSHQGDVTAAHQGQSPGYQQSFGQQDYSQQWANFYQQQAQVQQYQNYFNYQQQYYNQQSSSQAPRQ